MKGVYDLMSKYGYSFNTRSANSGSFKEPVHICGQIVKLNNGCPKPNRWLSGKIRSADGELYPVAGTGSIMLAVGDMVECDADEEYSDNYGVQYKVRRQSMIVPIASSEDEVISYLSGPAFKGVGVVTAKKLFDIYGKWTIPTISDNLFALTAKFHGISDSVIRVLQDGMRESSIFRRFSSVFPHLPATAINRIVEQSDKSFNFSTFSFLCPITLLTSCELT